ncbi:MAG: hypothetical protein VXW22_05865 [Pseudomonadota bacterium]|nr:hypothetical protein [Pseudomonadota bacterium]
MKKESALPVGIGVGVAIGAGVGVATDNIAIWLPIGIAIGAALGTTFMAAGSNSDEDNTDEGE